MEKVTVDHTQIDSFLPQIMKKLEWLDREELIKKFVSVEFNRFLEYYKNLPDLNKPDSKRKGERGGRSSENMTRFFLNLGKTDSLKPTSVIGLIKDYSGSKEIEIGDIDIKQNFSFFETESEYAGELIKNINGKDFSGRKIVLEIASAKKDDSRKPRDGKKSFRSRKPRRDFDRKSPGSSRKKFKRKR